MFACEIDFEVRLDGEQEITNVELKTVHPFVATQWGTSESDTVPVWYLAQAMWGLGITGRRRCIVASAVRRRRDPHVHRRARRRNHHRAAHRGAKFWGNHVVAEGAPPAIEAGRRRRDVPEGIGGACAAADDGLTAKVLRLRALDKEINARTAEAEMLEFEIKLAMKDAEEFTVDANGEDKVAATWKQRPYSWLDQAA
jgi:predicted phage-related endonuclease